MAEDNDQIENLKRQNKRLKTTNICSSLASIMLGLVVLIQIWQQEPPAPRAENPAIEQRLQQLDETIDRLELKAKRELANRRDSASTMQPDATPATTPSR